jgi:hypothetical protein
LDLERSGLRGRGGGFRVRNKSVFYVLGKDDLLCLFGTFSYFQPHLGMNHYDLESYLFIETTNKAFPEKNICHALLSERQVLKGNNKIFHYSRLFQIF